MLDFIRSVIRGKSFFTTRLGYCGLVDYEIEEVNYKARRQDGRDQQEDTEMGFAEVWILAGGSQPVVLYLAKQRPGYYYVCSEAYAPWRYGWRSSSGESSPTR
jgi:hypothetical protein